MIRASPWQTLVVPSSNVNLLTANLVEFLVEFSVNANLHPGSLESSLSLLWHFLRPSSYLVYVAHVAFCTKLSLANVVEVNKYDPWIRKLHPINRPNFCFLSNSMYLLKNSEMYAQIPSSYTVYRHNVRRQFVWI